MDIPSKLLSDQEQEELTSTRAKSVTKAAVIMCVLGTIFYCYEYYLRVAPSVMSAELKLAFGLSDAALGHLAACYYYAYTPMQIPVGMMMDKFGPRKILTFACALCVVGTYLFATTSDVLLAQIGRFLVGFGSAFAYVGVLKISNLWLPQKYFALMAGICTALGMFGGMTGALTMAPLVEKIGWQSTLFYSVVIGIILTFALWFILKDKTEEKFNPNLQTPQQKISLFLSLKEMVKSSPMWINGIIGCLTFLPISAFAEMWAVPFLESTGISKQEAAVGSSMVFLGFALGGPVWGLISDAMSSRRIPLMMGSFISAILMAVALLEPSWLGQWMKLILFLCGFFASAEILVFAVSNDMNRSEVSATAVAFTNMVVMIGGALLPPLIGRLLDNSMKVVNGLPSNTAEDFGTALLILPLTLVFAGILSYYLKETYKSYR